MAFPHTVKIVEVGPRDGLQNEVACAPVKQRISLINNLVEAGLSTVEAGSFVSPSRVPQMAHTSQVLAGLDLEMATHYPVLVPNTRGFHDAMEAGAKEIALFAAASESFSQKNINCSIAESLQQYTEVARLAEANNIRIRGYISCVLGCPYEKNISIQSVVNVAKQLNALGCYEISLGDTIGTGTPLNTQNLIEAVNREIHIEQIAVHFHDTYGQALTNIYAALELGVAVVDSSVAGLGGCPYAPGSSGNVATEEVVYMLKGMNIKTGVDLDKLVAAGRTICNQLGTSIKSKVNHASH